MITVATALIVMVLTVLIGTVRMYFNYIQSTGVDREGMLTRASHGIFMMCAAGFIVHWYGASNIIAFFKLPVTDEFFWIGCLVPVLVVWGLGWTIPALGWRGRGPRDGRLIYRYLMKILVGVIAWALTNKPELQIEYVYTGLQLVSAWCLITGSVKLILIMRGVGRYEPEIDDDEVRSYGKANFAEVEEALRRMGR